MAVHGDKIMKHELWTNEAGLDLFCLAGPLGDSARKLLDLDYRLVWTCDADSHLEAMKNIIRSVIGVNIKLISLNRIVRPTKKWDGSKKHKIHNLAALILMSLRRPLLAHSGPHRQ